MRTKDFQPWHRALIEHALETESWDALTMRDIQMFSKTTHFAKYTEYIYRWRAKNLGMVSVEIARGENETQRKIERKIEE